jgi:hypothetical protein
MEHGDLAETIAAFETELTKLGHTRLTCGIGQSFYSSLASVYELVM